MEPTTSVTRFSRYGLPKAESFSLRAGGCPDRGGRNDSGQRYRMKRHSRASFKIHMSLTRKIVLLVCVVSLSLHGPQADAKMFQLRYRRGDVIRVEMADQSLDWMIVGRQGGMTRQEVPLSQIQSLTLTESPAGEQLANIRNLIVGLSSDNYRTRQQSEDDLRVAGRRFQKFLAQELEQLLDPEAAWRLNRVLQQIDSGDETDRNELDRIVMTDGSVLLGDAGDFSLTAQWRGDVIMSARDQLARIELVSDSNDAEPVAPSTPVRMQLFHDHTDFDDDAQTVFDFSTDSTGKPLAAKDDVSRAWMADGLLMSAPGNNSYVGISGYPFRQFPDLPVGDNTLCVFRPNRSPPRFHGTTEMRFCLPNQPTIAAGVHEIGFFAARINHSRDIVMQAFDERGGLLATVESSDQQCSFFGVKSNVPIAMIRFDSNPYLNQPLRRVDRDYAIDTLRMSPPVRISSQPREASVELMNGDTLRPRQISIRGDGVSASVPGTERQTIAMKEVRSISFGEGPDDKNAQPPLRPGTWGMMLADHSFLFVKAAKAFSSELLSVDFSINDAVAICPPGQPLRYPVAGDFKSAKSVLVYPVCRIPTGSLQFTSKGFQWSKSKIVTQPLDRDGKPEKGDEEDQLPKTTAEKFVAGKPQFQPTVWLREPLTADSRGGVIHLRDGQQLAIGEGANFKLINVSESEIKIQFRNEAISIPVSKIEMIQFPAAMQ